MQKSINIQCVYTSKSNDYECISLRETTELRRLVRQSNQVENVVTRILKNYIETTDSSTVIVHFKRLGSRHIHKEIEIPYCVFGFNEIICKTCLKHIRTLTHKCNIIKEEHFEAI